MEMVGILYFIDILFDKVSHESVGKPVSYRLELKEHFHCTDEDVEKLIFIVRI